MNTVVRLCLQWIIFFPEVQTTLKDWELVKCSHFSLWRLNLAPSARSLLLDLKLDLKCGANWKCEICCHRKQSYFPFILLWCHSIFSLLVMLPTSLWEHILLSAWIRACVVDFTVSIKHESNQTAFPLFHSRISIPGYTWHINCLVMTFPWTVTNGDASSTHKTTGMMRGRDRY